MPESSLTPDKRTIAPDPSFRRHPDAPYIELGVASSYSFLRGASDPVDLAEEAYRQGYDALGIADRNSMAGVVRHWAELRTVRQRPLTGCRLVTIAHGNEPGHGAWPIPRRVTATADSPRCSRPPDAHGGQGMAGETAAISLSG